MNLCLAHRTLPLSSTQRTCHQRNPSARSAARLSSLYFCHIDDPAILLGTSSFTAASGEVVLSDGECGRPTTSRLHYRCERHHALTADKMKKCVWLRTTRVAQIEFLEWTSRDRLRHARFVGLRKDKEPSEVVKEHAGES